MAQAGKGIAAIVTSFWRASHAEVIVGRMLEGYYYQGERCRPRARVASLYVDQFADNDMSRARSAGHGVPIYGTIREALCLGGDRLRSSTSSAPTAAPCPCSATSTSPMTGTRRSGWSTCRGRWASP